MYKTVGYKLLSNQQLQQNVIVYILICGRLLDQIKTYPPPSMDGPTNFISLSAGVCVCVYVCVCVCVCVCLYVYFSCYSCIVIHTGRILIRLGKSTCILKLDQMNLSIMTSFLFFFIFLRTTLAERYGSLCWSYAGKMGILYWAEHCFFLTFNIQMWPF